MNHKIRLFVIGPRGFPGVQGGIEKFSEGFYPGLIRLGYDVYSFSIKHFSRHNEWKAIKFIKLPTPSVGFLEKPVYNFFATLYCILKRPDIVHVHSIASGMFIFLLKVFGLKVVARYNSRDYLHDKWGFIGKWMFRISERQFLLADHIITNNLEYVSYLQSLGRKNNISFVPNGIEIMEKEKYLPGCDKFFGGILKKNKYILFVGRITPEKGIQTMLEAFRRLDRKDMQLVLAGDSAHRDGYFCELKAKYTDGNIKFLGNIERERLNFLYANCSLFVIPSLYESMPNTLLEAMSFNCKIIASKIPAHQYFQFSSDSYFDPGNTEGLRSKIQLKLSVDTKEEYSAQLKAHEWGSIIEQVHQIHLQILQKN